jgi:RpiR family transcriptional regulator, carbohydrate utilization regulator
MKIQEDKINPLIKMRILYDSLRTSEKKVADYIEKNTNEIIHLSISALSEKCQVSETSVIRLCKAMGYVGYQDFKINLAKNMIEPVKYIHEELEDLDDVSKIVHKVMVANMKAIEDTLKIIDNLEIEKAINALLKAKRINFIGLGGSGAVAIDAQHKFFRTGIPCFAYTDSHMQIMSSSMLEKNDVVIGISHSGSTKDIVDALHVASKAGATTICITSSGKSPVTNAADIKLIVYAKELAYRTEPMASRIAQLSIIDILSVGVALRRKNIVVDNIDKTRAALITKRY